VTGVNQLQLQVDLPLSPFDRVVDDWAASTKGRDSLGRGSSLSDRDSNIFDDCDFEAQQDDDMPFAWTSQSENASMMIAPAASSGVAEQCTAPPLLASFPQWKFLSGNRNTFGSDLVSSRLGFCCAMLLLIVLMTSLGPCFV
jgi:hypothetical protein